VNARRAKKEVMLAEVPKWEAKYRDPINNAFKPKAAVNEGVGTMSGSAEDDRHTALNPEVPVYMYSPPHTPHDTHRARHAPHDTQLTLRAG
jgi:hypothetical protein